VPLKILLADDSLTAQNMGKKILTEAGYDVVAVSNGAQGLKKIASELPDLVILDVYMPGYTGLEMCERMRNSRETARTPVVLSVGKMEAFKPEEVTRVRADGLIVKPFEASELLAMVKKLEEKVPPRAQRRPQTEDVPAVMAQATPSEPASPEPEFVTSHSAVEIPQEIASTPMFGMDLISQEEPAPAAPVAADPIEFEVERQPEPVKIEEGPRMTSAAGLSGVFEMEPTAHPAAEIPAAPAPVEEFERFPAPPEPYAAPQPEPEADTVANSTVVEHDLPAPQDSAGDVEGVFENGPLVETWSAPPSDPAPLEYPVESFHQPQPEPEVQSAVPAPEVLPELISWEEPATLSHAPAQKLSVAAPVWVAEEVEIEPDDLAIPLYQQMQRQAQPAGWHELDPPAGPASAEDSGLSEEISDHFLEAPGPVTEIPSRREFEPCPTRPAERVPEGAYRLADSIPDSPAGEVQLAPDPVPAPEMEHDAVAAPEIPPPAPVLTKVETAVDPGRIASIVEQALERLKPELIAAVTRELEKENT